MKPEEFTQLIQDVRANLSDTGKVTEILATLADGVKEVFASDETTKARLAKVEADNRSLLESNMNLFMKVGQITPPSETGTGLPKEPEKKRFEDLFNEKGGLK